MQEEATTPIATGVEDMVDDVVIMGILVGAGESGEYGGRGTAGGRGGGGTDQRTAHVHPVIAHMTHDGTILAGLGPNSTHGEGHAGRKLYV